jgi:uncharacterized membrane protein YoaK (UPF0700 family)
MHSHDRRAQVLAALLAGLAGYIDATGFIASGGFFVSFMSGNSTRLGIGLALGSEASAVAAGLIFAFLSGVVAGAIAGRTTRRHKRAKILGLVALLLLCGTLLNATGAIEAAIATMAVAMGVVNNTFERNGEVSIGISYMTGSLVKLGQRIAAAILGFDRFGWVPYLLLWLCFVAGVLAGATVYPHLGLSGLWVPASAAALLAFAALRVP